MAIRTFKKKPFFGGKYALVFDGKSIPYDASNFQGICMRVVDHSQTVHFFLEKFHYSPPPQ